MKLCKIAYHVAVLFQNLSVAMSAPKNHTGSKMQLILLMLMLMFMMLTVCHAAKGKSMWEEINKIYVADLVRLNGDKTPYAYSTSYRTC